MNKNRCNIDMVPPHREFVNVQHFATASASPPFNMSCLGSSLAQILATGSADLPDTSGTIPAPLLIAWMVTFVLMMLPKALSGMRKVRKIVTNAET